MVLNSARTVRYFLLDTKQPISTEFAIDMMDNGFLEIVNWEEHSNKVLQINVKRANPFEEF